MAGTPHAGAVTVPTEPSRGAGTHGRILAVVSRIPRGRVATYGQVAALAGLPRQPRLVGYALSALPEGSAVPWQRVVNAQGRVSPRSGGRESDRLQRLLLEKEGVRFSAAGAIPFDRYRWRPESGDEPLAEKRHTGRRRVMRCSAASVEGYLRKLPQERRIVVESVREVIRENIPAGYREAVNGGAITWEVPLERYPDTYNGQPLCYVALAAQKSHYALYLMGAYGDPAERRRLEEEFRKTGKKLDMGKSCLRFKKLDDLPLGVIGRSVGRIRLEKFLARYEEIRAATKTGAKPGTKSVAKKAAPATAAKKQAGARKGPKRPA